MILPPLLKGEVVIQKKHILKKDFRNETVRYPKVERKYDREAEHLVSWEEQDATGENGGRFPNRD
jgi:hypothetical protein